MPALLWATHSYAPSSLPEACGISHDALTEDLQLQNKLAGLSDESKSAAFDHTHAFSLRRNSLYAQEWGKEWKELDWKYRVTDYKWYEHIQTHTDGSR